MRCVVIKGKILELKETDFITIFIGAVGGDRFEYLYDTMKKMKDFAKSEKSEVGK